MISRACGNSAILVHSVGGITEVWTTVTIKKMKMKVKELEEEEMGKKKEVHVFHVQTIQAKCEVKEEDGQLTHKNLQWRRKKRMLRKPPSVKKTPLPDLL